MKIKLDKGAYTPLRAHGTDAGLDLRAMNNQRIMPHSSAVFHTGVHVELPKGTAGVLVSKSGLNVKHGITSTGLIDESFRGEIIVRLDNHSDEDYLVEAGDKITQMVVLDVKYEPVEVVDELNMDTERGENGYGSTGR